MYKKIIAVTALICSLVSCQFTETMVLQEDGSGRMSIKMDLSEMMAVSDEFAKDTTLVKTDTIISFKDVLREKKDSISKLPKKEQEQLKVMEAYNLHMISDPEAKKMLVDVFIDFKDVSEANDLMEGLEDSDQIFPDMGTNSSTEEEPEVNNVAVIYSFKKGVFKRDAYIKDKELHKKQVDSLASVGAFISGINYKLKYTFPRKIKKSSSEDATYSLDGKTIELEKSFLEYLKNPDLLDLEVELEK